MNNNRITGRELRTSLNLLISAVTFGMVFFTVFGTPVGSPLFTGFMRSLGASDLVYGVIMALPVAGAVVQVFASYILESTGKRKTIFLISGFIHRLLWIPIAIIPLFLPSDKQSLRILTITVLITISSIANSITGTSFLSWAGALVPIDIRGRFFSKRTMISTISGAVTGLVVGKFIDTVYGFKGFAIVFIIASLFGAADIFSFIWIKNPPMEIPKERKPFLKLFTEPFSNKNYLRFILFVSIWNFGVNFAGPFFNIYMLENLKVSYFTLTIFSQVIVNIATILFIRNWGSLVDKYGNKPVTTICCSFIIFFPLLWLFATPQNYLIVLIINFFSGIFWPGYDMTATNQSIWLAPEKNRTSYLANYTLITSIIGIALAYICGGAFMQFSRPVLEHLSLPFILGQKLSSFHVLFILSSIIRLFALLFLLPRVKESNSAAAGVVISDIKSSLKRTKLFR